MKNQTSNHFIQEEEENMKCDICNKVMEYFTEGQTCGWKCNSCGNIIATTNDDGIDMDDSLYSLIIFAGNSTSALNIKCTAKIFVCSFIEAKEILVSGKEIKGLKAAQTRDILRVLEATDILYSVTPDFNHNIKI